MKRLILLRHGQTEWNTAGRFQGVTDIDLDDVGREQAVAAAKVLAGTAPTLLVSSDLRRARDTAVAVSDATGAEMRIDVRLRERGYGPWEGLTRAQARERYGPQMADWEARRPFTLEGVEDPMDLSVRANAVLTDVSAELPDGGTAILVSHGGTLRQAVPAFLGWEPSAADTLGGLGNCHWVDLRGGDRGWRLHGYNLSAS
ncbi:putative phosphoglycerate mutase [Stackebrandtia albiflava]|uniref:Putative phosphoglycerate mutase n=1 Tax=Stackebrandtia albiflava TaxID=406432 RepID=A0A562VG58_9ACTN|nr:histidine phosphatase family protein [Stackebrandtia albiflava]TWJ16895.1 putative phosphoglycerate mutase [Stackebrandtia albiflava]